MPVASLSNKDLHRGGKERWQPGVQQGRKEKLQRKGHLYPHYLDTQTHSKLVLAKMVT